MAKISYNQAARQFVVSAYNPSTGRVEVQNSFNSFEEAGQSLGIIGEPEENFWTTETISVDDDYDFVDLLS